jgi:hypothetical protein
MSEYYPTGGEKLLVGVVSNVMKFSGNALDSETGLYASPGAYQPSTGTVLAPAVGASASSNPQNLNPYSGIGQQMGQMSNSYSAGATGIADQYAGEVQGADMAALASACEDTWCYDQGDATGGSGDSGSGYSSGSSNPVSGGSVAAPSSSADTGGTLIAQGVAPPPPEADPVETKPEPDSNAPENELEPIQLLPDGTPRLGGWQYDLLSPGPLNSTDAQNFAGGQYSQGIAGQEGLPLGDNVPVLVYRSTDNPDPMATGPNGTYYSILPQVGGLQSAIDNAVNPNWGAAGTPGGNPNSNGLGLSNTYCVELPPGTVYFYGPISSQGGAWVGGGVQVFVPSQGYQYNIPGLPPHQ